MTNRANPAPAPPDTPTSVVETDVEQPAPKSAGRDPRQEVIELFLRRPLYAKIEGDEEFLELIDNVLDAKSNVDFDNYCALCCQLTPWTLRKYVIKNAGGGAGSVGTSRYIQEYVPTIRAIHTVCLRRQHFHTYVVYVQNGVFVQKIGQIPSMADIALGEVNSIPGISPYDRKELGRALGLFAHDTPLGAFVYLRRVFERMIDRAHVYHKEVNGEYLENWNSLRMGERIALLADQLPSVVRSNSAVWSLLSRSIHELSDDDAEMLFPLVKAVILEMLGEEDRHRQASVQREATRKALASATARFNSSPAKGKSNTAAE